MSFYEFWCKDERVIDTFDLVLSSTVSDAFCFFPSLSV